MTKVSDERRTDRELSDMIQSLLNHGEAGYTYVKIDAHLSALRELQSLRASIPGGVGVKVKPLHWVKVTDQIPKQAYAAYLPFGRCLIVCEFLSANHMVYRFNEADYEALDEAKAAAQADFERRILSALDLSPADTQCCMCGKTGLSTIEGDGGTECQLEDGRWTCSEPCWEKAGGYGPDLSPAEGEPVGLFRKTGGAWKQVPDEWADHPNVQPLYATPSNPVISDEMVEQVFQAVAPHIAGTDWREVRAAITAALSVKPQSGETE